MVLARVAAEGGGAGDCAGEWVDSRRGGGEYCELGAGGVKGAASLRGWAWGWAYVLFLMDSGY